MIENKLEHCSCGHLYHGPVCGRQMLGNMKRLIEYTRKTIGTNDRPVVSNSGGVYIWNQEQTEILAGPFDSSCHAYDARSKALDKVLKRRTV